MPYALFHDYLPHLAEQETRTVTVLPGASLNLPPAQYALCEMFCDEPGCDCRRVMFYVVSSEMQDVVAVVAYGWESEEFYAQWFGGEADPETLAELRGPILNLASPQSELAPAVLGLIRNLVLGDTAYLERVKRHYRLFRKKIDAKRPKSSNLRKRRRKRR